jgi:hypothetical protein
VRGTARNALSRTQRACPSCPVPLPLDLTSASTLHENCINTATCRSQTRFLAMVGALLIECIREDALVCEFLIKVYCFLNKILRKGSQPNLPSFGCSYLLMIMESKGVVTINGITAVEKKNENDKVLPIAYIDFVGLDGKPRQICQYPSSFCQFADEGEGLKYERCSCAPQPEALLGQSDKLIDFPDFFKRSVNFYLHINGMTTCYIDGKYQFTLMPEAGTCDIFHCTGVYCQACHIHDKVGRGCDENHDPDDTQGDPRCPSSHNPCYVGHEANMN